MSLLLLFSGLSSPVIETECFFGDCFSVVLKEDPQDSAAGPWLKALQTLHLLTQSNVSTYEHMDVNVLV